MAQTAYTLVIFAVRIASVFRGRLDDRPDWRKLMQWGGFVVMGVAFLLLWAVPGATTTVAPFLVLFGATYFFAEFGPNTTTFVYPAEIFPVRARTTTHGIAAAAGKLGAFAGTYALTALLPRIGLGRTSLIVAFVALMGAVVTLLLLPEPKGLSLEEISDEEKFPTSAVALGVGPKPGPSFAPGLG